MALLPYIIIGLGVSIGICSAAGYSGALLVVMPVVWFLAGFAAGLLLLVLSVGVLALFVDRSKPQPAPSRLYGAFAVHVMGVLKTLFRIRVHVRGLERLPEGRWLLVGNHRSAFDPIVTGWVLRKRGLVFISKTENMNIPAVGEVLHKAGFLSIDRENDRAALRTILAAAELLKSDRACVGVYPEGTRNRGEGLLPFRNGVFKIAQKADVPVVCAAIRGTEQVLKRFPWRSTDVTLDFCGVMDAGTVRQSKTQEIGETIQEWITNSVNT